MGRRAGRRWERGTAVGMWWKNTLKKKRNSLYNFNLKSVGRRVSWAVYAFEKMFTLSVASSVMSVRSYCLSVAQALYLKTSCSSDARWFICWRLGLQCGDSEGWWDPYEVGPTKRLLCHWWCFDSGLFRYANPLDHPYTYRQPLTHAPFSNPMN